MARAGRVAPALAEGSRRSRDRAVVLCFSSFLRFFGVSAEHLHGVAVAKACPRGLAPEVAFVVGLNSLEEKVGPKPDA